MSGIVLHFQRTFETEECITCGTVFAVVDSFIQQKKRDHGVFYCPNGHNQFYQGKSDVEKLRDQLADKERQLAAERERASTNYIAREKAERQATRLKKRISGGACPCCKRSFISLARHMKAKHPDFAQDKS